MTEPSAVLTPTIPPSNRSSARSRLDPRRLLLAFSALIVLLVIGLTAGVIVNQRAAAIGNAEIDMSNLGGVLAEQTGRTVQNIDLLLASIDEIVVRQDAGVQKANQALSELLRDKSANVPEITEMVVAGPRGAVVASSLGYVDPGSNLSGEPYFVELRDNPSAWTLVRGPVRHGGNGAWTVVVCRRLSTRDGSFGGAAIAYVEASYFESVYATATAAEGTAISLLRDDGILLVRYPRVEALIGKSFADSPIFRDPTVVRENQTVALDSIGDNQRRISAPRAARGYSLIVVPSVTQEAALAGWRHDSLLIGTAAGAALIAISVLLTVLQGLLSRVEAAEATARSSHKVLQDAIEAIPDGFVLYDADDRFAMCNEKFREMRAANPISFEPGARYEDVLRSAIMKGEIEVPKSETANAEEWLRQRMAQRRQLSTTALIRIYKTVRGWNRISQRRTSDGGVVAIHADITELKTAEADAERSRAAADEANRAKSEFLANMSHEIRTPMNGIMGMNAVLLETELDEEQRQCAQMVQDSAEALLGILNDILDVSKLEVGRIDLETIDFDLTDVVERAIELMSSRAREKKIDLGSYIDPALQREYAGDPTRLRQVLLNLVGNAIKFTDHGSVVVEVRKESEDHRGTLLRFEVMDTGIGISEEAKAKLFQKFSQADPSITRRFGGTGLGLSISRQLVELMGGTIGVESQPGKGSTFWFTARLAPAEAPVRKHEILPEQLRNLRVLVVDDTEMNRRILERQLTACEMRVTCVEDGFAAIAEVDRAWHQGRAYDLVLLDQMMPGMSGEVVAKRLRADERFHDLKIVLSSSMGVPDGARNSETSGFDAILVKPVRRQTLLDSLARLYGAAILAMPDASAPVPQVSASPAQQRGHILVADDNQVNQQIALKLLRRAGYTVDLVSNGVEAVGAVRRGNYDLVLMDVQMPSMDGVEATRKIRALEGAKKEVPIIALTAHAMRGAREEYLAAGMDDYISKPFDRKQFVATIDRWMDVAAAKGPDSPEEPATSLDTANGTGGHDLPIFDEAPLATLAEVLPADEIRELVATYLSSAVNLVAAVEAGAAARDLTALAKAAHSLISTSGNFGARRVQGLAQRLEAACRGGNADLAHEISAQMRPASEQVWAAIRARFG